MDPPSTLRDVRDLLRREHPSLAEDPDPLKTVMQFDGGRYCQAAFYALPSSCRAELPDVASDVGPTGVTLRTLHYCADHLRSRRPASFGEWLQSIVEENAAALLAVETRDGLVRVVRKLQERHLPVRVLVSALHGKPARFVWNPMSASWQEGGIADHLQNLWSRVRAFYEERGWDEDLLNAFRLPAVVASVHSDATMERRDVRMDAHPWFLRLGDGAVLDLRTGRVGASVPEYYLSDRKVDPAITSGLLSAGIDDLYRLLVEREFLELYRKVASLDVRETLADALAPLVPPDWAKGDLAASAMRFYVDLCQWTGFDHEGMLYLLDVLASVLVGTNHERKFYVWKGRTRNGKSKLFEVMGRALGGYYRCVRSENLARSGGSATPDLASALFACRMVTVEELGARLDENRVKQIAGDSAVSFRNLYEPSSGGVPHAKVFATTNHRPECRTSEAFRDRVVAVPFEAEFADDAPAKTSEQVARNRFPRESRVVERSYRGCFAFLFHHYRRRADPADGLLHCRKAPGRVVAYTEDFLAGADVYVQFKIFADVQPRPGARTTAAELLSAVRRYLVATRGTGESELLARFDAEFGPPREGGAYGGVVLRGAKRR